MGSSRCGFCAGCIKQGRLPADVWAKIASQLGCLDILTMRLVSQQFSNLANLSDLRLEWNVGTPEEAASLAKFVIRHCMKRPGPWLHIYIPDYQECKLRRWSCLTLALSCSNLRSLDCASWDPDDIQVEAMLQLVPPKLECLAICVAPSIVEDPGWTRLTGLTHLGRWKLRFCSCRNRQPSFSEVLSI